MSVLDGWWDEAYRFEIGWAIGRGEVYEDHVYQDEVESKALYEMLEKEVIPLFYDRGHDGLPRGWIARMKAAMAAICPIFNTNRMVHEYAERFYLPAAERWRHLTEGDMTRAKALAAWRSELQKHWEEIQVTRVESDTSDPFKVGAALEVQVQIHLGPLKPGDVTVQLYEGPVDTKGEIVAGETIPMTRVQSDEDGCHRFVGRIPCRTSGLHGYALRVLPYHEDLVHPYEPGLMLWA